MKLEKFKKGAKLWFWALMLTGSLNTLQAHETQEDVSNPSEAIKTQMAKIQNSLAKITKLLDKQESKSEKDVSQTTNTNLEKAESLDYKFVEIDWTQVMLENLRADTTWWKEQVNVEWTKELINPQWDVWQNLETWEFYFKRKAAQRECEKQWLNLLLEEQMVEFYEINEDFKNSLLSKSPGYRTTDGTSKDQGSSAFYWSASERSSTCPEILTLDTSNGLYRIYHNHEFGFSARCSKNQN